MLSWKGTDVENITHLSLDAGGGTHSSWKNSSSTVHDEYPDAAKIALTMCSIG